MSCVAPFSPGSGLCLAGGCARPIAARAVFARFPGAWQTREQFANTAATAFWRRAIPVPFVEQANDEGPFQQFTIP